MSSQEIRNKVIKSQSGANDSHQKKKINLKLTVHPRTVKRGQSLGAPNITSTEINCVLINSVCSFKICNYIIVSVINSIMLIF